MSRLQKKCLVASTTMHSLLVLLLFLSPAFMRTEKKIETIPVITLIPGKLIDDAMMSGGNPSATAPAPRSEPAPAPPVAPPKVQSPPPQPKATPPPRRTEPPPVRNEKKPQPKPAPVKEAKTDRAEAVPTEKPAKTKPKIEPKFVETSESDGQRERERTEARARAEARAQERALREYQAKLNAIGRSLSQNLSGGTSIEPLGPGGEAYLNYGWAIREIYENAWTPDSVADSEATVKVTVVIRRDGTVISSRITKSSGESGLDRSVQQALERVRAKGVPPFPEGAKDEQRTFHLNFNLKAKRLSG